MSTVSEFCEKFFILNKGNLLVWGYIYVTYCHVALFWGLVMSKKYLLKYFIVMQ